MKLGEEGDLQFADDGFGMVAGETVKDLVELRFALGVAASLEGTAFGEQ